MSVKVQSQKAVAVLRDNVLGQNAIDKMLHFICVVIFMSTMNLSVLPLNSRQERSVAGIFTFKTTAYIFLIGGT